MSGRKKDELRFYPLNYLRFVKVIPQLSMMSTSSLDYQYLSLVCPILDGPSNSGWNPSFMARNMLPTKNQRHCGKFTSKVNLNSQFWSKIPKSECFVCYG